MPSPDQKLSPALIGILALLFLSLFISYIDRGAVSIALPMLEDEFHLSRSQLGVLLSAFFWSYAVFLLISGWLADKFHAGRLLASGFLVWSAATLLTAAMRSFGGLLGMRLLLGVGESTAYPCFSKLLVSDFPERHRGFANAFISVGIAAGPAFGLLVGGLLMTRFGWRPYFVGLGCAGLLWLPLWLAKMPRETAANATNRAEPSPTVADILMQRSAWGTFGGHFGANYLLYFLLTWLPYYLVRERHFSLVEMGKVTSLAYLTLAFFSVLSGILSDRWIAAGQSATTVRKGMIGMGQLVGGIFLAACGLAGTNLSVAFLLLASAAYGFNASNLFAITQTLAGPRASGKWTGLQNFCGNLAGVASPAITGFVAERTGNFVWAFLLTGLISILGAVSWFFVVGPIEPVVWREANTSNTAA
jgi:MFS family permease